jgi:Leucine rich repeat
MSVHTATTTAPSAITEEKARPRTRQVSVVGGLVLLAGLAVFNLFGRSVIEADIALFKGSGSSLLVQSRQSQIGWPWPCLRLASERAWPLAHLQDGVRWTSASAMLGDVLVASVVALIGGWLLGQRSASRRKLWQFGLLDLALVMTAAALAVGYLYLPAERHREEARLVADLQERARAKVPLTNWKRNTGTLADPQTVVWQPGAVDWLRQFFAESWMPETSHVVAIETNGTDVRQLVGLVRLRVVRLQKQVSDTELNGLAQLPELETLDISACELRKDRGRWLDPPHYDLDYDLRLPRLKRLVCQNNVLQGSDLADFAALEELYLRGSRVDDASLVAIRRLKSLRVLDLRSTKLDDQGLATLAELERLEQLDIRGTAITPEGYQRFTAARPDCAVQF